MLLQFSVENYKSFKNLTVLSLEASDDAQLPMNYITVGEEKYLNAAVIFGANASGKTNIFSAFTAAIMLIRKSNIRQVSEPLLEIVPYKFDRESLNKPTFFEFVFCVENKKYVYGFKVTQMEVHQEYLYRYDNKEPNVVFERTGDVYKFESLELEKELQPITIRNTHNKLFLATATAWNSVVTKEPYLWFDTMINTYSADFEQLFPQTVSLFEGDKDGALRRFTNKLLHAADINIDDYELEIKDVSYEQLLRQLPVEIRGLMNVNLSGVNKSLNIETIHTITNEGELEKHSLSLGEESQGTRSLFAFAPVLKRAFENGEVLCIDEFGASLHPILIGYLFALFNNPKVNKANAQLIVSSHSMVLMSLENLRRDQIYFVEKNRRTGVSELYSLDEFSPREEENIRKAYLLGRYGSVPDISVEANLW